jgi:hypothetical protein
MARREGDKRWKWIGLAVIAVIVLGVGGYFLFREKPVQEPLPAAEAPPQPAPPAPAPAEPAPAAPAPAKEPLPAASLGLADSDEYVRQKGEELAAEPAWAQWLANKNLIRRLTAAVVNIAEGKTPRKHLDFLAPQKPFTALKKEGGLILDPRAYERYNFFAEIVARLDAPKAVRLFKDVKPVFQEAYRELGYPQGDFQAVLIYAIQELLLVPVVEGEIAVKEAVLSYWMVDDALEDLTEAQKHLLRMGPENTLKIQKKLREIALLLGAKKNQLPESRTVKARNE